MSAPRRVAACAAAVALLAAACSSESKKVDERNIFPAEYKDEILRAIPELVADPTNIRGAFLSDPVLSSGATSHYFSCLRFNPRDSNRQYLGSRDQVVHFYGGHINQILDATREDCAGAAMKPFPELEKLCLGTKCA